MEMFCKLVEVFLNKYFFNTIFSISGTLLINIILPNNYWMIEKIGITLFRVFVFCTIFSLSCAIVKIYETFRNWRNKQEQIKMNNYSSLEKREKNIELWRNLADDLSYYDRNVIVEFINNGNTQRLYNEFTNISYELEDSQYLLKTRNKHGQYVIKLNNEVFEVFSYIYEKYGKLGHFDE